MKDSKPLDPKEAADRFGEVFRTAGVSPESPDIRKAWETFKEFCAVPIERTAEGFIFHASVSKFKKTAFNVGFTRYWYEKGEISNTVHLAECGFALVANPRLKKFKWVDVDVWTDTNHPAVQRSKLQEFVQKAEANEALWGLLFAEKPTEMHLYTGPQ